MRAIHIVKEGAASNAFEIRDIPVPEPGDGEILIKVEAFGLNFADIMARKGMYPDRPAMPAVVGYDVVGRVEKTGPNSSIAEGTRVTAMTRFGGYAEYAVTNSLAAAVIPDDMDVGVACALTTQYCTAWYAAVEMVTIHPGDKVMVHAAAGGVGTALVQIAKMKGAEIFGTAGSASKLEYAVANGVKFPINYKDQDWVAEVKKHTDNLDIIFDSVGAKYFKQGKSLLASGGRIVSYGASSISGAKSTFGRLMKGLGFGIYHPVQWLSPSHSLLGVNMLRIADDKPEILARCLAEVVKHTASGALKPEVGARYPAEQIAEAHDFMEARKSIGKIVMNW